MYYPRCTITDQPLEIVRGYERLSKLETVSKLAAFHVDNHIVTYDPVTHGTEVVYGTYIF